MRLPTGLSNAQQLSQPLLRCGPVLTAEELSLTLVMSAAMPASPPTLRRHLRSVAGAVPPSRARKRALSEWDKANPDAVYDPELFRREILPRLGSVPLAEIVAAAGCSKASASDIRRGKWTPHVSTWGALGVLVGMTQPSTVRSMTERSPMAECPRLVVVRTSSHRRLAEALAPAEGRERGEEKMSTDQPTEARNAYDNAMAPVQKAYDEARAAASKAYDEANAAAGKAYDETMAPGPQGLP